MFTSFLRPCEGDYGHPSPVTWEVCEHMSCKESHSQGINWPFIKCLTRAKPVCQTDLGLRSLVLLRLMIITI